jgi:hypothetical protein
LSIRSNFVSTPKVRSPENQVHKDAISHEEWNLPTYLHHELYLWHSSLSWHCNATSARFSGAMEILRVW